jgi:hypothetical protein
MARTFIGSSIVTATFPTVATADAPVTLAVPVATPTAEFDPRAVPILMNSRNSSARAFNTDSCDSTACNS